MGRLGNVLFEIASVIGLGKKLGRVPCFDIHPNYDSFLKRVVEKYPAVKDSSIETIGDIYKSNFYEFYEVPTSAKVLKLIGYLQTPTYFEDIKDDIKELFKPSEDVIVKLKSKYFYENLVAVHIRGGDYKKLSNIYESLGSNYYSKAIKYFKNKNSLSKFIIFTDDEPYAKSILKSCCDSSISYEFADQSNCNEFEVIHWMSLFKNIIIANSTFSWWGAYLGNANEVIAPLEWYSTEPPSDWADIYPTEWITLTNKNISINGLDTLSSSFWDVFKVDSKNKVVIVSEKSYVRKSDELVLLYSEDDVVEELHNIDYIIYSRPHKNKYPSSYWETKPQIWVGDINSVLGYKRLQNTILTLLNKPELSILLPVYNTPLNYIRTTITSIYKQSFRKWEVLLMDDGSNSLNDFYERYSWKGILIIRCGTNYKLPSTLNRGIIMSRTDLIARMDSDDIMLSKRLEIQYNFMRSHPNVGVCGCQMLLFSKSDTDYSYSRNTPILVSDTDWSSPRCLVAHPSVIYRRNILKKVNYYTEDALHYEDLELWSKLYRIKEPLVNIPDILMMYRIHPESVSRKHNTKQRDDSIKLFNKMWKDYGNKGIKKYIEKAN